MARLTHNGIELFKRPSGRIADLSQKERFAMIRMKYAEVEAGTAWPLPDGTMPKPPKARRQNPNSGGWYGHPNSLRALERHRAPTQWNGPKRVLCRCGRAVVSGLKVCWYHGGQRTARKRVIEKGLKYHNRGYVARNAMSRLLAGELLPFDLLRNNVFAAIANEYADLRAVRGVKPQAERDRIIALVMLLWELVNAWTHMVETEDNGPWMEAYAKALTIGAVSLMG